MAYADFVTAMMAFFLVMWICAQDQKIKQAVARYFVNPVGLIETGASKTPDRTGAVFPSPYGGAIPKSESVTLGRGRISYSTPTLTKNLATKAIGEWLRSDKNADQYWHNQVRLTRDWAEVSRELLSKHGSVDEAATLQLAKQLKDEIRRTVSSETDGLTRELLSLTLADVNWTELAEDLLCETSDEPTPP